MGTEGQGDPPPPQMDHMNVQKLSNVKFLVHAGWPGQIGRIFAHRGIVNFGQFF
jgi:hypothetical protein